MLGGRFKYCPSHSNIVKVLLLGDAHGHEGILEAAQLTQKLAVDAAIILGDVWDIEYNIDGVTTVPIHIVFGNHEKWNIYYRWSKHGHSLGRGLIGHKNYTKFEIDGRVFGVIGRIEDNEAVRTLMEVGIDLGDPEQIFFRQYEGQKVRDLLGGIDVLIGHDAPYPHVLGHRPVPKGTDYISAGPVQKGHEVIGSDYLNAVIETLQPKYYFGGHMHKLCIQDIGQTRVYNLPPIDPRFQQRGYVILDTNTMRANYYDL